MSAPRKGKDISALKARLAKRANPGAAPGPEAQGAPGAPLGTPQAPAQPRPSTGAQAPLSPQAPAPAAPAARPEPAAPRPAAPQAAAPKTPQAAQSSANPFAGGSTFDPNEGLVGGDPGEFKPNKGGSMMLVAGVALGLVGGGLLGWMANMAMGKRGKVEIAVNKAGKMIQEVDKVSKARRSLAIEWDGIKKNMASNPKAGQAKLKEVMQAHFDKGYAREDALFGWQLGSMGKSTINDTFSLYRSARDLKSDLRELALFTQKEGTMLGGVAPKRYAVLLRDSQAQLIEFVHPICGADLATGKECPPNARKKPVGAAVRLAPNAEVKKIPLEKIAILTPTGPYFSAAIASDPKMQAQKRLAKLVSRVDKKLSSMNAVEAKTLEGFKKYQSDPNIDKDMQ